MIGFISLHYQNDVTLQEIASAAGVSRSKACRLFQIYIGTSPVDFLQETGRTVSDISMDCGFHSFSYYSMKFRRKYGMTPREWRRQQRNRENRDN